MRPVRMLLLALTGALGSLNPGFTRDSRPATLRVVVKAPASTPRSASLYLAGNVNAWNPGDPAWRISPQPDGTWATTFQLPAGYVLQFKLTRGTWETVEKDSRGGELPNRILEVQENGNLRLDVASWRDQVPDPGIRGSVSGDLRIHRDFPVPELGTTRTLRILLPPGYEESTQRYPVLYLQDGQNLFDAATSFAGEWEVDESLQRLVAAGRLPPMIVVGVDHGGSDRLRDYAPFPDRRIPAPRGDAYADFLARTLKPWMDRTYRTRPGPSHTVLGGSSMGGLITLHAVLRHPEVFGRAACFSPSFWVGGRAMEQALGHAGIHPSARFYLDVGGREGGAAEDRRRQVEDLQGVARALLARGLPPSRLKVVVDPEGLHQEADWARRFPEALLWLMEGAD